MGRLRRSCLAVPGSSPKPLREAATLAADRVFLDLEHAVAPLETNGASRRNVVDALCGQPCLAATSVVRLSAVGTRWRCREHAWIAEHAGQPLDCSVLPRVETRAAGLAT